MKTFIFSRVPKRGNMEFLNTIVCLINAETKKEALLLLPHEITKPDSHYRNLKCDECYNDRYTMVFL